MVRTLFLAAGLSLATCTSAADPAPVPKVTAVKLVEAFMTNEAFADENYSGKEIEVTGKVARVSRSKYPTGNAGERYYVLELDVEGAGKGAKLNLDLLLFFDEKDRANLAKLKPGESVRVRGECDRRTIWSGKPGQKDYSEVHVKKCSLVANKAAP